jgi:hypothetical protein
MPDYALSMKNKIPVRLLLRMITFLKKPDLLKLMLQVEILISAVILEQMYWNFGHESQGAEFRLFVCCPRRYLNSEPNILREIYIGDSNNLCGRAQTKVIFPLVDQVPFSLV